MRRIQIHEDGQGLTELCRVYAADKPHPVNGTHYEYRLRRWIAEGPEAVRFAPLDVIDCGTIRFQRGPRTDPDSTPGILDGCLLAILIDRYECFQAGPFASETNDQVLAHLRGALDLLNDRARERAARGVLGKNER